MIQSVENTMSILDYDIDYEAFEVEGSLIDDFGMTASFKIGFDDMPEGFIPCAGWVLSRCASKAYLIGQWT